MSEEHLCHPVLRDMTGKPLPHDEVHVQAVAALWTTLNARERKAYHRVECRGGGNAEDRRIAQDLRRRIKAALDDTPCCRAAAAAGHPSRWRS